MNVPKGLLVVLVVLVVGVEAGYYPGFYLDNYTDCIYEFLDPPSLLSPPVCLRHQRNLLY